MPKHRLPSSLSRRRSEQARAAAATPNPDAVDAVASLGGPLGKFLSKIAAAAEALAATDAATVRDAGSIPFTLGGKEGRAVFGYTIRSGLDGLRAEPFGNVATATAAPGRGTKPGPAARAPIVDVFQDDADLHIVAELPGVSAEDIACTLQAGQLRIVTTGAHVYSKTIELPCAVDATSLQQSCRNGILEVRLRRDDAA
jgi:HSP20 family protein